MRIIIFFSLLLICSCASKEMSQKKTVSAFEFEKIAVLPDVINESSGLISINDDLYTHNDSGGGAYLYQIDTIGNLKNTYKYELLSNIDWEAITLSNRYLHIADMGNNKGNRKDLKIYNILLQEIDNNYTEQDVTTWSYKDQIDYSIRPQKHAYDAEAIVNINNIFYLFSKNWIDFTTSIYPINSYEDNAISPIQTIDVNGLITDATHNHDGKIILCGYNQSLSPFIVELKFENNKFKMVNKLTLPIEGAQIEAITYHHSTDTEEVYYLTSEAVSMTIAGSEKSIPGELYKLSIPFLNDSLISKE